ncbi:YrbL family protein [Psychroserpens sp. XS_ASV72]|uniref:YrbL family protein n=1 Tax=Psychroserpens sp. XS_ASV72 TaxID=3241293 RepID=UPI003515223F
MIQLSKNDYMAEGLARICYYHPEHKGLCIKIGKPDIEEEHLYKEINYYKKISKKDPLKFDYPFYAFYHGTKATSLGEGFIYDLVRDETTQEVSKTLLHYIRMKDCPFDDAILNFGLDRLKSQMIKHKVFASDLRPRNICVKILSNNTIELVIVDGIGHRDFFPFADWFGYFAKKKVERRFNKIHLQTVDQHRKLLKRLYPKWVN